MVWFAALKIAREIEGEDKRSTLSAWALNCLGVCPTSSMGWQRRSSLTVRCWFCFVAAAHAEYAALALQTGNCYSKNNQNPIHAEGFFRSALSIYEDPATNIRNDEEVCTERSRHERYT
jgi:hypothetical protein